MNQHPITHTEDDHYYSIVWTSDGHSFFIGPFPNRSAAYRRGLKAKGQSQLCADYDKHLTKELNDLRRKESPTEVMNIFSEDYPY
jgi:hypothetical protein